MKILVTGIKKNIYTQFKKACFDNNISMAMCIRNLIIFYVNKNTGKIHPFEKKKSREKAKESLKTKSQKEREMAERELIVVDCYNSGTRKLTELSKKLGYSRSTVRRIIVKFRKEMFGYEY